MRIQRDDLLNGLESFARLASGLVVGSPGSGKSYVVADLNSRLEQEGIHTLLLAVEVLGDGSESDIRQALGLENDLIPTLASESVNEAVLIIDGFDAARAEAVQRNLVRFIGRCIRELPSSWRTIVVVRTYDAKKSPELIDLFPQSDSRGQSNLEIACRHFHVPPLSEPEIAQLAAGAPQLFRAYSAASGEFRELLRVPFNLWLLERLLPESIPADGLSEIRSQVQLLTLFWQRRVAAGPSGPNREQLLNRVTLAMIQARALSVPKSSVLDSEIVVAWNDLLSAEVLVELSSFGMRVRFGHNILFDYAVSVLVLEDNADGLIAFLAQDYSRQLFLRPSLVFLFARLWYHKRGAFWRLYREILPREEAYARLLSHLVPPSVVAQESRESGDLQPLLEMIDEAVGIAGKAALYVLRAVRAWDIRPAELWIELLEALSERLRCEYDWEVGLLTELFLNRQEHRGFFSALGRTARNLLNWAWGQRPMADALIGRFGVPLVAKTFATHPEAARAALAPVLGLVGEPNFPLPPLYRLTAGLADVTPWDPKFVGDVYRIVFRAQETSEEQTHMGGSTVLVMLSTRRQDFEMCQYQLLEYFPKFLKDAPAEAIAASVDCVNTHVLRGGTERGRSPEPEQGHRIQTFPFRGGTASYIPDGSVIWDSHSERFEPIRLLDEVCRRLRTSTDTGARNEELETALEIFRDRAQVAVFWRRLLILASENPERLRGAAVELCSAVPILRGADTLYEVGKVLTVLMPLLPEQERESIERAILSLANEGISKDQEGTRMAKIRDRHISQIPTELLVTSAAVQLRKELERTERVVENRPLAEFSSWTGVVTDDDWLKEQGVDVQTPVNARVRDLTRQLDAVLGRRPEPPGLGEVQAARDLAAQLRSVVDESTGIEQAVADLGWTSLGKYANLVLAAVQDPTPEVGRYARDLLLICARHPSPKPDPEFDARYNSPSWSPSPRTEAAQGLPLWIARKTDAEALAVFTVLVRDPVPSVRFLSAVGLWRIANREAVIFWELATERAKDELNPVVLQGICQSLGRVVARNENKVSAILDCIADRALPNHGDSELRHIFLDLLMWLAIARGNTVACTVTERMLADPLRFSKALESASFCATGFLRHAGEEQDDEKSIADSGAKWLLRIIESVDSGIRQLVPSQAVGSEESPLRDLYGAIHNVVRGVEQGVGGRGAEPSSRSEMRQYYWRVKPVMERVLRFASTPSSGLLAGYTAYQAMRFLKAVLSFDPPGVLSMASGVAVASRPFGYNLDSLAIDQVVDLVEVVLAEFRDQVRDPESVGNLLNLLEIFAETGWPQAMRLVWRLDEVFR